MIKDSTFKAKCLSGVSRVRIRVSARVRVRLGSGFRVS